MELLAARELLESDGATILLIKGLKSNYKDDMTHSLEVRTNQAQLNDEACFWFPRVVKRLRKRGKTPESSSPLI